MSLSWQISPGISPVFWRWWPGWTYPCVWSWWPFAGQRSGTASSGWQKVWPHRASLIRGPSFSSFLLLPPPSSSSAEYGLLCMFISCPSGSYQVPIWSCAHPCRASLIRGPTFSSFLPPPPSMNLGQVHLMSIYCPSSSYCIPLWSCAYP